MKRTTKKRKATSTEYTIKCIKQVFISVSRPTGACLSLRMCVFMEPFIDQKHIRRNSFKKLLKNVSLAFFSIIFLWMNVTRMERSMNVPEKNILFRIFLKITTQSVKCKCASFNNKIAPTHILSLSSSIPSNLFFLTFVYIHTRAYLHHTNVQVSKHTFSFTYTPPSLISLVVNNA